MQVPAIDITAIYPEVVVALVGLLVLVIDLFIKPQRKGALSVIVLGQERDGVQRNGRR